MRLRMLTARLHRLNSRTPEAGHPSGATTIDEIAPSPQVRPQFRSIAIALVGLKIVVRPKRMRGASTPLLSARAWGLEFVRRGLGESVRASRRSTQPGHPEHSRNLRIDGEVFLRSLILAGRKYLGCTAGSDGQHARGTHILTQQAMKSGPAAITTLIAGCDCLADVALLGPARDLRLGGMGSDVQPPARHPCRRCCQDHCRDPGSPRGSPVEGLGISVTVGRRITGDHRSRCDPDRLTFGEGTRLAELQTWLRVAPMMAFVDHGHGGTGEPVAALLRTGRAAANDAADQIAVLDAALAQLPAQDRKKVWSVATQAPVFRRSSTTFTTWDCAIRWAFMAANRSSTRWRVAGLSVEEGHRR